MEIRKPAVVRILESSGYQVTVELGGGNIESVLESAAVSQYRNRVKRVVMETLENLGVKNVKIAIVDKGALDYTIRAGIEGVVFRAAGQYSNLPWGGAIR